MTIYSYIYIVKLHMVYIVYKIIRLLHFINFINDIVINYNDKGLSSQSCGFPSSRVQISKVDCKESWVPKNWYFWIVVLKKTLESPLDCKEIQPVNLKGNQSWTFIGRTDTEAEAPILWPLDAKNWLLGIYPDAGKDWRQEEKGTTEDEMVGWYHWLNGHEFEQVPGVGEGQGSLACFSPYSHKESDMTEWLHIQLLLKSAATENDLNFKLLMQRIYFSLI